MTTIVKAANAAQFLSLVPRMLGFRPTRSIVLVPFAGTRTIGVMRVDLPRSSDAATLDRVAATLIGMACRVSGADAVTVVAYTDARFSDDERMPHRDLIAAIERRADASGLHLNDALCVAADGWASHFDPDAPATGHPLDELQHTPAGAEHLDVADGDQSAGADLPMVDPAEKERTAHALTSLEDAVRLLCGEEVAGSDRRVDPTALSAACALDDLPVLFEDALRWDAAGPAPFGAATLIWCLGRPSLRDIALVQWHGDVTAGDEAFAAQLRWEAGEEYPAHLAMFLWGEGERPDPERLETALTIVRRVAAAAPRAARSGPLATCAWLSWALGRSTHAEHYASLACEIEPEHGLAEIVLSFVMAGHLPDWAFRRSATAR